MEDVVARLDRFTVRFGARTALDGIDLEIRRGELTVVLGPSGSGKTTLLRSLNRLNELFDGWAREGTLRLHVDDRDVEVHDPAVDVSWLRRRVAFVFQSPNVLPLSIRRNVELPLRLGTGLSGAPLAARARRALEDAELWEEVADRLDAPASTLSGGQQQRLCLARALALEPAVLLLDEPTASLDVKAARKIEGLVRRLKDRYTVVAVSHSLGQASRLADRAVVLREGRLVESVAGEALRRPDPLGRLVEDLF